MRGGAGCCRRPRAALPPRHVMGDRRDVGRRLPPLGPLRGVQRRRALQSRRPGRSCRARRPPRPRSRRHGGRSRGQVPVRPLRFPIDVHHGPSADGAGSADGRAEVVRGPSMARPPGGERRGLSGPFKTRLTAETRGSERPALPDTARNAARLRFAGREMAAPSTAWRPHIGRSTAGTLIPKTAIRSVGP